MNVECTTLLADVLAYIEAHHGNLKRLADEASVNYDWLCSIRQGRRKNPRIAGIQKILDHKQKHIKQAEETAA